MRETVGLGPGFLNWMALWVAGSCWDILFGGGGAWGNREKVEVSFFLLWPIYYIMSRVYRINLSFAVGFSQVRKGIYISLGLLRHSVYRIHV